MEPAAAGPSKPPPAASKIIGIITGAPTATVVSTTPTPGPSSRALAAQSSFHWRSVVAVSLLLVAAGLGGGALLAWWAVAFHRAHAMLWMVPVGLVLIGTSLVSCLSVLTSGPAQSLASADLHA